jgi:hypothetical protein
MDNKINVPQPLPEDENPQDDFLTMRQKMDSSENAPQGQEEGFIKKKMRNIGQIFTRPLSGSEGNPSELDAIPLDHPSQSEQPDFNTRILSSELEEDDGFSSVPPAINMDTRILGEADDTNLNASTTQTQRNRDTRILSDDGKIISSDINTQPLMNEEIDSLTFEDSPVFEDSPQGEEKSIETSISSQEQQPVYYKSPTVPRDRIKKQLLDDDFFESLKDPSKTMPLPDLNNDEFIAKVTNSLKNDRFAMEISVENQKEEGRNEIIPDHSDSASALVADLEQEIDNAANAVNPFEVNGENQKEDDFLSRLKDIFPHDYKSPSTTTPLEGLDSLTENDNTLSSDSWREVLKSTEEKARLQNQNALLPESHKDPLKSSPPFEEQWQVLRSGNTGPLPADSAEDTSFLDSFPDKKPITSVESSITEEGSLDNLRRSFIEEFDQSPWNEEENQQPSKNWTQRNLTAFRTWLKSLNTAEKVLMVMSSIICLVVIIAIAFVMTNWPSGGNKSGTPPVALELADSNLVYPTGLQLPGGWFFFLQRGEITDGKWNPQNAEWVANTTIRRVVGIPWSRQAEAVFQSLQEGDEIQIFMNNNDIMVYYIDEVKQVERDNVREIFEDTKPSVAILLFQDMDDLRWTIIARP